MASSCRSEALAPPDDLLDCGTSRYGFPARQEGGSGVGVPSGFIGVVNPPTTPDCSCFP
jgi:hypothetical protein